MSDNEELHQEIVPVHLAVKAMQDNGYKNAAYAIAELIDNSIQAGAKEVELICTEETVIVNTRRRTRIRQIGVLDNGAGMDKDTLRIALQFGNGTHLKEEDQTGMGRFGMGLPNASISQAHLVEVWTWKDGPENALYTYLDVDQINKRHLKSIPEPIQKPIPETWKTVGKSFGKTGTLVVWSRLERCFWKTAAAIIDNSELLIGRIYRYYLKEGAVKIRLVSVNVEDLLNPKEAYAKPNDPLYLMDDTSCPIPFEKAGMFQRWGEVRNVTVEYGGKKHNVRIAFSYAKPEARASDNAGNLDHGRHAGRNIGVSILRAGRELSLDETWTIKYDPTERWWGAEIEFPPALDDLFGVTNNKQEARNFIELGKLNVEDLLKGKTLHELREEWVENEDPRAPLLEIAHIIQPNLTSLRSLLKKQTEGSRSKKRYEKTLTEEKATIITKQRQEQGHEGTSDSAEKKSPEDRKTELTADVLKDLASGETPTPEQQEEAAQTAARIIDKGLKYEFAHIELESSAFFSVKQVAGLLKITLNVSHPAYKNLIEVLERSLEEEAIESLKLRLQNASDGLKLLLLAWARYEDEQPDGPRRHAAAAVREDWGRMAREFLTVGT